MARKAAKSATAEVLAKGQPDREKPALPVRKQAVVVVHGMGEQRPMATLRDLVTSLAGVQNVYIVPDPSTGSAELARIRVPRNDDAGRPATDFYEFYYADLLGGGTFAQLRGWILGLMIRWPHQVPREVVWIWLFLWVATIATLWWLGPLLAGDPLGHIKEMFANIGAGSGPTLWQRALLAIACLLLSVRLSSMAWIHNSNPKTKPNPLRTLPPQLSYLMAVLVPAALFAAGYFALPWKSFAWPDNSPWCSSSAWLPCAWEFASTLAGQTWFKIMAAAAVWYLLTGFGVAYFGDVARYVGVSPDSIDGRRAIRERGLKLLEELHKRPAYANGEDTKKPEYERILIVAHSLGSIVAFDLMRIFWAERNMCNLGKIPASAHAATNEMAALPNYKTPYSTAQVNALAGLQDKVALSIRDDAANWRITDFITMGSPLARADFLMSRDWPRFEANITERRFPTCPPVLDQGGFTYFSQKAGGQIPHHAAMFTATRWLAIFDPVRGLIFGGDFIGGPVRKLFGEGISQLAVKITRKSLFFPNVFTHTNYWRTDVSTEIVHAESQLPSDLASSVRNGQIVINVLRKRIWPNIAAGKGEPET